VEGAKFWELGPKFQGITYMRVFWQRLLLAAVLAGLLTTVPLAYGQQGGQHKGKKGGHGGGSKRGGGKKQAPTKKGGGK
jgi:hypothetical protein